MASLSLASASSAPSVPHFEKRTLPAPELAGLKALVGTMNEDSRSPQVVLKELTKAKAHFEALIERGAQTKLKDSMVSGKALRPILHSENARSPGLNALNCDSEIEMVKALRDLSTAGRKGEEGHVRFHLGIWDDSHRIAVDAFRHRDGGFTLVAVDSMKKSQMIDQDLEKLSRTNPDLIKGAMVLPTPNLVHFEGCRIFAIHHLNALHDYEPHIQSLHRELHDKARGRAASRFSGSNWTHLGENIHTLNDAKEAFGLLPGKFFKHMQVKKPKTADKRTSLDQAEDWNPALRDQPVNKKGQTLRARLESQNPQKPLEEFSYAERTLSLDRKRLVLIDRAIAHYEKLAAK